MDCNSIEEACTSGSLIFAIDSQGNCCGLLKSGGGTFNFSEIEQAQLVGGEGKRVVVYLYLYICVYVLSDRNRFIINCISVSLLYTIVQYLIYHF